MAFKFKSPVPIRSFTTADFMKQRHEYIAKHGYNIELPALGQIIKWEFRDEPTPDEMKLYAAKDKAFILTPRYGQIQKIVNEKRANLTRMLSSPSPDIAPNVSTILTTLDDINDTLGTFALLLRIIAAELPQAAGKALMGPAGWALTAADIAGIAMQMLTTPFKAKRIQHELHALVHGSPYLEKSRLRRADKMRKAGVLEPEIKQRMSDFEFERWKGKPASYPELIELFQVTQNITGFGLCLGPIMGLCWDLPSGLARHVAGEKVTITGLPTPLIWWDQVWSRTLKSAACLWTQHGILDDKYYNQSLVAMKLATDVSHSYLAQVSPLDAIDLIKDLQMKAPEPQHTSTKFVLEQEGIKHGERVGWPGMNESWTNPVKYLQKMYDKVNDSVGKWLDVNKNSEEARVASIHATAAGETMLANLEGDDMVERNFEPFTMAMLRLMNLNLRFPKDCTPDQVQCFRRQVEQYYGTYGDISTDAAQRISIDICGFHFTTEVPERPAPTAAELAEQKAHAIDELRLWHAVKIFEYWKRAGEAQNKGDWEKETTFVLWIPKHVDWLKRYGWIEGEPLTRWQRLTEYDKNLCRLEPDIFPLLGLG